jgi:hypothetical protein
MLKFFNNVVKFLAFFLVAWLLLLVIDVLAFDRISNPYLIHVLRSRTTKKNIVIGSSKVKWGLNDSLVNDVTVLADAGQFTYGSIAVLMSLKEHNLLKGKKIFIDLEESDEVKAGFGKWWYFSEAFLEYRYSKLPDYEFTKWPLIAARVTKDISHFSPNSEETFHWTPLELRYGDTDRKASKDSIINTARIFQQCAVQFTTPYKNSLLRLCSIIEKIEREENCQVFIILLPFPRSGCTEYYREIFGKSEVIDFTKNDYDPKYFYDNNHLNSAGANKFSKEFENELERLHRSDLKE